MKCIFLANQEIIDYQFDNKKYIISFFSPFLLIKMNSKILTFKYIRNKFKDIEKNQQPKQNYLKNVKPKLNYNDFIIFQLINISSHSSGIGESLRLWKCHLWHLRLRIRAFIASRLKNNIKNTKRPEMY